MIKQFLYPSFSKILFSVVSILFLMASLTASYNSNINFEIENRTINDIQFEAEIIFSEPEEIIFGTISTSAASPSGKVFLGDNGQKKIHVFDADGNYVDSFGREGSGPGEFQMIRKIITDDHQIHVFDVIHRMVHVFKQDNLRHVRSISLTGDASQPQAGRGAMMQRGSTFPNDIHLLSNGDYMVTLQDFRNPDLLQSVILSPDGKTVEENRFEFRTQNEEVSSDNSGGSMRMVMNFPHSRNTKLSSSGSGLLFSNWNENLEFTVFDESGNRLHSFSQPYTNAELNKQDVLAQLENMGGPGTQVAISGGAGGANMGEMRQRMLQNMEIPDTWPAVDKIYADKQNRLWVAAFTDKRHERKWFLFDEKGNKLAEFTWPSIKNIIHADGNTLFVQTVDEDELAQVIRYRFTLS